MNPAVALALLAVVQLGLAWLTDRTIAPIDQASFVDAVRNYQQMDIGRFFSEGENQETGHTRAVTVLKMAQLASAGRAAVTALIVSAAGLLATLFIILVAKSDDPPSRAGLRLGVCTVALVIVLGSTVKLFVALAARTLMHVTTGEEEFSGRTVRDIARRYFLRVRSSKVLTPYLTVALVGNVVAILAAYGL